MLSTNHQEHIQSLEFELTQIADARNKINILLENKLSKEEAEELGIEITGILMFVQNGLHRRILALRGRRD